jgi:uncharacterized membrane protein
MSIVGFIEYDDVTTPVVWANALATTVPTKLNLDGGGGGYALGINSLGQIVGNIKYGGGSIPVVWANALATTVPSKLNLNGGLSGVANGITMLGQIVGFIYYTAGVTTPVVWTNASATTVPISLNKDGGLSGAANGINSVGQIVGSINNDNVYTPVIWANSLETTKPTKLNLDGRLYGTAHGINNLGKIVGYIDYDNVNTPVIWADALALPTKLNLDGGLSGYAYGINSLGQIVGYINYAGVYTPVVWANALETTKPTKLNLDDGLSGYAYGIQDPPEPAPTPTISNICFPAGTPITTDQGIVPIEQINTRRHTLQGQAILHVTQTVTLDKYLISFPKNVLGRNMPSATTVMTKDHKIMFQDQLVPAYRFLHLSKEIKKVTYSGKILYNVLLANHGTMVVNNMECETLHPENKIAQLYMRTQKRSGEQAPRLL